MVNVCSLVLCLPALLPHSESGDSPLIEMWLPHAPFTTQPPITLYILIARKIIDTLTKPILTEVFLYYI